MQSNILATVATDIVAKISTRIRLFSIPSKTKTNCGLISCFCKVRLFYQYRLYRILTLGVQRKLSQVGEFSLARHSYVYSLRLKKKKQTKNKNKTNSNNNKNNKT